MGTPDNPEAVKVLVEALSGEEEEWKAALRWLGDLSVTMHSDPEQKLEAAVKRSIRNRPSAEGLVFLPSAVADLESDFILEKLDAYFEEEPKARNTLLQFVPLTVRSALGYATVVHWLERTESLFDLARWSITRVGPLLPEHLAERMCSDGCDSDSPTCRFAAVLLSRNLRQVSRRHDVYRTILEREADPCIVDVARRFQEFYS